MQKRQSNKKPEQKQERIVHKGIFISNQRRKGPGGRIKCQTFDCKVEVMDFNPAIHESEVEWVEIRRYIRGEKRDQQSNNRNRGKTNNNDKKDQKTLDKKANNNNNKNGKKYVEASQPGKDSNPPKNQTTQQKGNPNNVNDEKKPMRNANLFKKFVEKGKQTTSQKNQQNKQKSQQEQKNVQQADQAKTVDPIENSQQQQSKPQAKNVEPQTQEIDQEEIETQSEKDDLEEDSDLSPKEKQIQIVKKQQAIIVLKKTSEIQVAKEESSKELKQGEKQKQKEVVQEIIVARIIKETKIMYQDKRFVAILTCQKKRDLKNSFVQKEIKPIQKICKDYFLDVTPIHSRLPKMQLDNLVPENLKVLDDYIEKTYPQKGKDLTKKKLNEILDVVESIYVVASFGLWEKNRPYANIHQVIGKTMTIDGECNCFLFEHHLNDFNYQDEVIQKEQDKQVEFKPTEHHKKFNKMVFSIDPSTSIDLDDALSVEKVDNGDKNEQLYEIGIHISDVSEYLKYIERSELIKRTTSVYLPHKVYHMLTPEVMKISSLNPNVERLAFSIYVRMNLAGQIVGQSRIEKNVIMSRFKLSYQTVQDIITAKINFDQFLKKHPGTSVEEFDTLVEKLQMLTKIGLAHRQKRIQFEVFENREIHFELDQDKWPIDISVESRFTSKKIVEEYMIIGNVEAASHLIKSYPQNSLIIYHPMPSDLAIKSFNDTFKFLNRTFTFDDIHAVQRQFLQIENDKTIDDAIKQYIYFKGRRMQESAGYKLYNEAVKEILEKMNKNGENGSKNGENVNKIGENGIPVQEVIKIKNVHFALGQDFYTHFTSPMRRMADILVHQTLNSLIYKTEPKPILPQQIQKINLGRKHTKRLKKDLTEMYICLMIHKTGKVIKETGIVTSFGLKSVSVYIPYFDMMKEIIWRDELVLDKVSKNRQNEEILDVCIYYDRKSSAGDIYWKVKKYDQVGLIIDCTRRPPLRLAISLEVTSTKGKKERIDAKIAE